MVFGLILQLLVGGNASKLILEYTGVDVIAANAYADNKAYTSLEIEEGYRIIGQMAFMNTSISSLDTSKVIGSDRKLGV